MLNYTRDELGGRVFEAGGRRFRAYWLNLGHEWSVREIDSDGQMIPERRWTRRNWREVEKMMDWVLKLTTSSL